MNSRLLDLLDAVSFAADDLRRRGGEVLPLKTWAERLNALVMALCADVPTQPAHAVVIVEPGADGVNVHVLGDSDEPVHLESMIELAALVLERSQQSTPPPPSTTMQ